MADAKGIGTIEYGKIVYGMLEVRNDYAARPGTIPDYAMLVQTDYPLYYLRMDEVAGGLLLDFSESQNHTYYMGDIQVDMAPIAVGGTACLFRSGGYGFASVPHPLIGGPNPSAFTIECWMRSVGEPTGERLLVGRNDLGLYMTPTGFEFRILDADGNLRVSTYTTASWDRNYHVVAVYGGGQMLIYVNGYQSNTVAFDNALTLATGPLYVGGTGAAGPDVYLDEVAVYRGMLPHTKVFQHYNVGLTKSKYSDLSINDGALYFPLSDSTADVAYRKEFRNADLLDGARNNLSLVSSRLILSNPAAAGVWTSPLMDLGQLGIVDSSRVDWDATNSSVIVEVSLNLGTTWTALTNHNPIPGIGSSTDLTDKIAQFRVTIPAGAVHTFSRLSVTVFKNRTLAGINSSQSLAAIGNANPSELEYDFLNERNYLGTTLTGGYLTLNANDTGFPVRWIDFFVRRNAEVGASWQYILDARTALAEGYLAFSPTAPYFRAGTGFDRVYIGGVLRPELDPVYMPVGEWTHVALRATTAFNGVVTLGARYTATETAPASFAHLGVYANELSSDQIFNHAANGWGKIYAAVGDFRLATLKDRAPTAYSYDWQVIGA